MTGKALRANGEPASLAERQGPIVLKLGGSVIRSPELSSWLDAIAAAHAPIVVVPGGGALADEVRACQAKLGFGDPAAHRMALLAMDQLAWAVAGLRAGFQVGATEEDLRGALERGLVAVWAPYALIAGRTDVEEGWRITSDSLALWLAARLGARRCYLIKSIARPASASTSAAQLARDCVVDEAFPSMLAEARVPTVLLGRGDQQAFAASLSGAESFGAVIE
jgi:5-(aminomethyl)-3-furanmethanol phosphate kinase